MTQTDHTDTIRLLMERVNELETKMSFLELTNQELSDLVYEQQQQIDRHMRQIADRLNELGDAPADIDASDEIPPHY